MYIRCHARAPELSGTEEINTSDDSVQVKSEGLHAVADSDNSSHQDSSAGPCHRNHAAAGLPHCQLAGVPLPELCVAKTPSNLLRFTGEGSASCDRYKC